MRNIAASLTEAQILERSKDVTRRMGWKYLKKGDRLQVCRKCMGRKPGEPLVKLAVIEVVSVRREKLRALTDDLNYGFSECRREGFPLMTPRQFVEFFCASHKGCDRNTTVTRIEFLYIKDVDKTGAALK